MTKRGKLDIINDMLQIIKNHRNPIKPTPLLRKSNLSSSRFKEYITELKEKGFIKGDKKISLTEKGFRFLEKYQTIINFIDEFEL